MWRRTVLTVMLLWLSMAPAAAAAAFLDPSVGALATPAGAQEATPEIGTSEPREIELPGTRVVSLSPDGRSLVAAQGEGHPSRLCVYDVETLTERSCGDLESHRVALSLDSVVWSPDSTRIAFAEDAFRMMVDGDLWLMDAATGEITNLTDDGFEGSMPLGSAELETPIDVDILPAWAPDGRSIAFSRSTMRGGEHGVHNEIVRLDLSSGETERLLLVSSDLIGIVYYGLVWAPDGQRLYYTVNYPTTDDQRNGVWVYNTVSGLAEHILRNDPDKGPPVLLRVDATGGAGLIFYPLFMMRQAGTGDYYALLDLESNALSPANPGPRSSSPEIVQAVAFAPAGTEVLYSVWRLKDGKSELRVWDPPNGRPTVVAAPFDGQILPTTLGGSLVWADDGTVFVAIPHDAALLLQLEPALDSAVSEGATSWQLWLPRHWGR